MKNLYAYLLLAALSLVSTAAFAVDQARIEVEKQWLASKKTEAYTICNDSKMSNERRREMICDLFGVCPSTKIYGPTLCEEKVRESYNHTLKKLEAEPDTYLYSRDMEQKDGGKRQVFITLKD